MRELEIEVVGKGGGVCLCQEYEYLSASYAKSLSVFVCVEMSRVRVLTHCPGRDTAKTAVLVIRQLFTETKQRETEEGSETSTHANTHTQTLLYG